MLTLFKNITAEVTDLEKTVLVPHVLMALQQTNENCRITSHLLCIYFKAQGHTISGVRLRKIINYIRVTNAAAPSVVIGANNGYFLTTNPIVIQEQIDSLQGRIDSMAACIDTMTAQKQSLKNMA